jgi:RNA polymerase sigma-70 factor (ECF subfamily)
MPVQKVSHEMDLLDKVSQGDEKAFGEIFHLYRNKVYTIAFRLTVASPVAEEILLDVFLQVWLKREELKEVKHFKAWLFTITRNRTFSMLKQMAAQKMAIPMPEDGDELLLHATEHPGEHLQEKEYRQILRQAVTRLSPQQKKVYTLIKEQGLKREEAASALNIAPETVKRHLSEAMHFIRVYCLARLGMLAALILLKELL